MLEYIKFKKKTYKIRTNNKQKADMTVQGRGFIYLGAKKKKSKQNKQTNKHENPFVVPFFYVCMCVCLCEVVGEVKLLGWGKIGVFSFSCHLHCFIGQLKFLYTYLHTH